MEMSSAASNAPCFMGGSVLTSRAAKNAPALHEKSERIDFAEKQENSTPRQLLLAGARFAGLDTEER
jgi:hypothetical protein